MFGKHFLLWTLWFFGAKLNECDNFLSGGGKTDDLFMGNFDAKSGEVVYFYIEDPSSGEKGEYEGTKVLKAKLLSGSATLDFFDAPEGGKADEPYNTIYLESGDCEIIRFEKDPHGSTEMRAKRIEMTCTEPEETGVDCKLELVDRFIFMDYSIF